VTLHSSFALEPFLPVGLAQRYPTLRFDRAHMAPLDVVLSTGVLGLAALAGLFLVTLKTAAQKLRSKSRDESLLASAVIGSLAAHIIETAVAFPSTSSEMLVAVMIGLVASNGLAAEARAPARQTGALRIAIAALTLLALAFAWGRPILADHVLQRGLAFSANLDAQRAQEHFQTAVSLAPWVDPYRLIAINETISRAADAPRENSRRPSILDSDADPLSLLRNAVKQSRDLTRWSPDDAFGWSTLAQTLNTAMESGAITSQTGSLEAMQAAEEAARLAPRRVLLLDRAARTASANGAQEQARDLFTRAAALDGPQAERIAEIGDTYRKEGDLAAAERQYQQAIARDSRAAVAWSGVSQVYLSGGRVTEALDAAQRAARFQMREWRYHAELGRALARAGDRQPAQQELRTAARLAPAWEWPALRSEIESLGVPE
jgi:tetratricopeptide (TPR) repeat protein